MTLDGVRPEDRLSRTFCFGKKETAADLVGASEGVEKAREDATKGLKERTTLRSAGISDGISSARITCVCVTDRCVTVRCVRSEREKERGEINKHIKPRDSFTPDKNMSRDTYLDPPLPYLVGLPALVVLIVDFLFLFLSPSRRSFASFVAIKRVGPLVAARWSERASLMTVLIMYN